MRELLLSGTILTAFLGGVVALLAPCCVSVMLPAYFSATFARRSRILAMTLVFAIGVGTVILPIGLGASAISRLLAGQHFAVFAVMGVLLAAGGAAMIAGGKMMLPMPGMRGRRPGVAGVYVLGVFSGAASACCAPVLAGVAVVSGAAASFPAALAVGVAYVFGMVAPLSALALLWDRRDWATSRLFTATSKPVRVWGRAVPLGSVISGVLLVVMGMLTVVFAFLGPGMGSGGWQLRATAFLGHTAATVQSGLGWLPGWVSTLLIFAALAGVVGLAVRHHSRMPLEPDPPDEDGTGPGTAGRGVDDQQSRPAGPPAELILSREKDLQS